MDSKTNSQGRLFPEHPTPHRGTPPLQDGKGGWPWRRTSGQEVEGEVADPAISTGKPRSPPSPATRGRGGAESMKPREPPPTEGERRVGMAAEASAGASRRGSNPPATPRRKAQAPANNHLMSRIIDPFSFGGGERGRTGEG